MQLTQLSLTSNSLANCLPVLGDSKTSVTLYLGIEHFFCIPYVENFLIRHKQSLPVGRLEPHLSAL